MDWEETVKSYRNKCDLTRKEFAQKTCLPDRTIENWEQGRTIPADWVQRILIKEWENELGILKEVLKDHFTKEELDKVYDEVNRKMKEGN